MAEQFSSNSFIYWNTWYRADPKRQINHIDYLVDYMAKQGNSQPLLCLSEATLGQDNGLVDYLSSEGYSTAFKPTSKVGKYFEGLCFASRQPLVSVDFTELRKARAIANTKTRWIGNACLNGISTYLTHTSYPQPAETELDVIRGTIEETREPVLLGGDFNTLTNKKTLLGLTEELGLVKIKSDGRQTTVPFIPGTNLGVELDHVFASHCIADDTALEIGPAGPSNHRPLLVAVG